MYDVRKIPIGANGSTALVELFHDRSDEMRDDVTSMAMPYSVDVYLCTNRVLRSLVGRKHFEHWNRENTRQCLNEWLRNVLTQQVVISRFNTTARYTVHLSPKEAAVRDELLASFAKSADTQLVQRNRRHITSPETKTAYSVSDPVTDAVESFNAAGIPTMFKRPSYVDDRQRAMWNVGKLTRIKRLLAKDDRGEHSEGEIRWQDYDGVWWITKQMMNGEFVTTREGKTHESTVPL